MYKRSKSSIFMMGVFGGAVFSWYGLIGYRNVENVK